MGTTATALMADLANAGQYKIPAANDNVEGSMAFLRKAINAPTIPEVEDLIKKNIIEFNFNKSITLNRDGVEVKLSEEPRHFLFPELLVPLTEGIPIALIGPAGSGKSTTGMQLAKAVALPYYLQNSVQGAHELTGYMDAYGKYHSTSFRAAFERGGLILVDEADTSDPGALKWMNTALANGYAMFPDKEEPVYKHQDFRIIMAANTYGTGADRVYVGANQLDASTLDRFVFFDFQYDEKLEAMLSGDLQWSARVQQLRANAIKEKARIVISPRASINGAKLLRAGWNWDTVEDRTIFKGMDPELKARIRNPKRDEEEPQQPKKKKAA